MFIAGLPPGVRTHDVLGWQMAATVIPPLGLEPAERTARPRVTPKATSLLQRPMAAASIPGLRLSDFRYQATCAYLCVQVSSKEEC